jgi:hypothetical protein
MKVEQLGLSLQQLAGSIREFQRFGILQHLERSQLAVHEFTAVFPIAPSASSAALTSALRDFDPRKSVLCHVPGLHTARWMPLTGLEPRQLPDERASEKPFAIVLAFLCDGNVLDVLEELFEHARGPLERVLEHCSGYVKDAGLDAFIAYCRSHRIRSNYLFRDSRQLDPGAAHLHPSSREIQRALRLRKRVREFVIDNQGKSLDAQRDAFREQFSSPGELPLQGSRPPSNTNHVVDSGPSPGLTLPLTGFERPLAHEGMWIRRTAEIARTRARRDARARSRAGETPVGLRGVHAKHHGLLEARLRICDDVPLRLRHGIFIPGREYEAWVRPSNSDLNRRPDWLPDARGIAIKLVGVNGEPLLERPIPNGLGLADGRTQDFTLVSHPTFFARDARDYAILRSFVDARPDGLRERLGVGASVAAFLASRPRELSIFLRTLLRWCRHPLLLEYHSLLPFLVGPAEVAKCSLQPTAATRRLLESEPSIASAREFLSDPNDYLQRALQRSLDTLGQTPLIFDFALQIAGEQPLPIEDPRLDWSRCGAERVVVATLTIRAQDATSSQRMASAEALVMTPWHSLAAHRPLGSLNRARLTTYLASQEERWKVNGMAAVPRPKPEWSSAAQDSAERSSSDQPAAQGGGTAV